MDHWASLVAFAQLGLALLVYFGVTPDRLRRRPTASSQRTNPGAPRNRLMLFLIIGGLAATAYSLYRARSLPDCMQWINTTDQKMTPVVGRQFSNEKVEVDGQKFIKCEFHNVTFVFKGSGAFGFVECVFSGSWDLYTPSPGIGDAFALAQFLRVIDIKSPMLKEEAKGQFTPAEIEPMKSVPINPPLTHR